MKSKTRHINIKKISSNVMAILDFKCYIQNVRSEDVQKKFKVVFKNQIDLDVFSKDFYQTLLENILKLKRQKEIKNPSETDGLICGGA